MRLGPCEVRLAKKARVAASAAHTTALRVAPATSGTAALAMAMPKAPASSPKAIDPAAAPHEERGDDAVEQGQDEQEGCALRGRLDEHEAQSDDAGASGEEQRGRGDRELVATPPEGLATRCERHEPPVEQQRRDAEPHPRLRGDPLVQLRHRQHEGDRRQPGPTLPDGDRGDAGERGHHVGDRGKLRFRSQDGWRCQRRDQPEAGHDLGARPDGDEGRHRRRDEDPGQGDGRVDEAVERGRGEEGEADDREPDRRQDVADESVTATEEDRPEEESGRAAGQAEQHLEVRRPIEPRLKARLRKKTAPRRSAVPPTIARARPAKRSSMARRSNVGSAGAAEAATHVGVKSAVASAWRLRRSLGPTSAAGSESTSTASPTSVTTLASVSPRSTHSRYSTRTWRLSIRWLSPGSMA